MRGLLLEHAPPAAGAGRRQNVGVSALRAVTCTMPSSALARLLLALLVLTAPAAFGAASSAQIATPRYTSVAGGESQVFSARFFDAARQPARGETVRFSNDACGTFQNGMGSIDVVTDANGIASATFTARNPPGITCWVNATSGAARVVFDVLTYRLGGAYMTASVAPALPGQPFKVTAVPKFGLYALANVEVTATVVRGSGGAAVAPLSANTGDRGLAEFTVTPDFGFGDYEVEIDFRGHKFTVVIEAADRPWQDMWWAGPAENGWGMSLVQHGDMLFGVIYAYDEAGKPTWWVMPGGKWNEAHTAFTGALYSPRGTPFHAYDAARFAVGPSLGSATIHFTAANTAELEYTLGGATTRKSMSRQLFGPADVALPSGVGDMWWGGVAQNGWGIAVLQQYRTLFMVWFTYDAAGAPTWFVMPQGSWMDATTYEGRILRTTGAPWLGRAYDPSRFSSVDVGSYRLRLEGTGAATLGYSIEGRSGMLELTRQPF